MDYFIDRDRELGGFRKLLQPETTEAVMLIEAGELMGKTWLLNRMSACCKEELAHVPVVSIDFKDALEQHKVQDPLSLIQLIRNKLGYPEYFTTLDEVIRRFAGVHPGVIQVPIAPLVQTIQETYNLDELHTMVTMRLGPLLKWENLSGDTIMRKAVELVTYFQRRHQLSVLIEALEYDRPQEDWRQGIEPLLGPPAETSSDLSRMLPAYASGIVLPTEGRDLAEAQINEAFLACLKRLTADVKPIVFLFDGCEEVPAEAESWIRVQLIDRLGKEELDGVVIILTARKFPPKLDLGRSRSIVPTKLNGFDESRVREFFEVFDVKVDNAQISLLVDVSGGQPGMLAKMVDNLRAKNDKEDPFFQ